MQSSLVSWRLLLRCLNSLSFDVLQVDGQMEAAQRVVTALRGLRHQYGLQKQRPIVSLGAGNLEVADGLEAAAAAIATLSMSSELTVIRVKSCPCNWYI